MDKTIDKTKAQNGSQMRINDAELDMLKRHFADNDELLRIMRKIFLPEIDPNAPVGQVIDLWMTVDIKDKTPDEAYAHLVARNLLISHLDQQLNQIKVLAGQKAESVEETKERLLKNSSK